jgi:putative transposase
MEKFCTLSDTTTKMMKTFEYRLYPNRRQRGLLMRCLIESRHLYNEMLAQVKDHHAQTGEFLFKYSLTARFKGRGGEYVPASTVQTLADRLDKALRRFIARRDIGQTAGFPRFKGANRWHSIRLRQYGKSRDTYLSGDRLKVPKKLGKSIKVKQHRPLEGSPRTACLKLRADGKWYVLITCELQDLPSVPQDKPDVGIDVGLKHFLADSQGNVVSNPRHLRKSQKKLRRAQRKLTRRKKGSHRRKKAARAVAKIHLKVARQRRDFLHKTAKGYTENYNLIVVEKLNIAGMAKNRYLARDIHDAGWTMFIRILEYKAEEAGAQVIKVPAYRTTQDCSECGELVPKSLSDRRHACRFCGYEEDRDVNAARNIKLRGVPGIPLSTMAGIPPSEPKAKGCLELAPRSRLP